MEVIDALNFDAVYGTEPDIVHVSGAVYAIVYSGPGADGWLITVSISPTGTIGSIIDSFEFDEVNCNDPNIIHISGTIFAISYTGEDTDGFLKTISIAADGTIGAVVDTLEFDTTASLNEAHIIHVTGTIYAIGYEQSSAVGNLITVDIDNAGNIGAAPIDTLTFDTSIGYGPFICHVTGTVYALVYRAGDGDGQIVTCTIDAAGNISAVIDHQEFDTGLISYRPCMLPIGGSNFAIFYTGTTSHGVVTTISVDGAGNIGAVIATAEFDATAGYTPVALYYTDTTYIIAYGGEGADGYAKTIPIAADGTIGAVSDTLEFDDVYGLFESIVAIDTAIWAIAYRGNGTLGWLKTVGYPAAPGGGGNNLAQILHQNALI